MTKQFLKKSPWIMVNSYHAKSESYSKPSPILELNFHKTVLLNMNHVYAIESVKGHEETFTLISVNIADDGGYIEHYFVDLPLVAFQSLTNAWAPYQFDQSYTDPEVTQ